MNNNYKSDDIVINLLDLVCSIFLKWKIIIVAMIACGIAAGGYSYVQSNSAYQQSIDEQDQEFEFTSITERDAKLLLDNTARFQNAIDSKEQYLKDSVLMNVDPNNVTSYYMQYVVNSGSQMISVGQMETLMEAYELNIKNDVVSEAVAEALKPEYDINPEYISELIGIEMTGTGNFNITLEPASLPENVGMRMLAVRITGYDAAFCERVGQVVDQYMQKAVSEVSSSVAAHSLQLVNCQPQKTIRRDYANTKQNEYQAIVNLQGNITNLTKSLTDAEKEYVEQRLSHVAEEDAVGTPVEKTIASAVDIEEEVAVPHVSKKYILLGMVLGAFAVFCWYGMLYILSRKIHTPDDLEDSFKVTVLGVLGEDGDKKCNSIDRMILKLRHSKGLNLPKEETLDIVKNRVVIEAEQNQWKVIGITGTASSKQAKELQKDLERIFGDTELTAVTLGNLNYDPKAMKDAVNVDAVVVVEAADDTERQYLVKELAFCNSLEKPVIGAVVLRS